MSDGKKYYCFCGSNCKYETMTKEQILAAIAQAVQTGEIGDVDTGFVTKIKEMNSGKYVSLWVGSVAAYNALQNRDPNWIYLRTDATDFEDLQKAVVQLTQQVDALENEMHSLNADRESEIAAAAKTANNAYSLAYTANNTANSNKQEISVLKGRLSAYNFASSIWEKVFFSDENAELTDLRTYCVDEFHIVFFTMTFSGTKAGATGDYLTITISSHERCADDALYAVSTSRPDISAMMTGDYILLSKQTSSDEYWSNTNFDCTLTGWYRTAK